MVNKTKNTLTKFPADIDERMFFQDISISQVETMNMYYSFLDMGNYTAASDLLNNSDVFFYGAWLLNLFESQLNAIGRYLIDEDEHSLMTYNQLEPSELTNVYNKMNWISDYDLMEFREDYIPTSNINMYFGDIEPTNSFTLELGDTWVETGENSIAKVGKEYVDVNYQDTEPQDNMTKYKIWID